MYNVEPQGMIYLCKTPLENDYKNQLTFTNSVSQATYFNTTVLKTFSDYTYQRHDGSVKVGANIDDIIKCNYMFYRNVGFSDKIYYCFITDMQYVNENCTLITFETDVFQTYQFDINYKMCFTEREHVNDDTAGNHTVPEGLELGDYVLNDRVENFKADPSEYVICMGVTELPDESTPYNNNRVYNSIYGGLYYLGFADATNCTNAIKIYDGLGKSNAIISLFMIPNSIESYTDGINVKWTGTKGETTITSDLKYLASSELSDIIGTINIEEPNKVGNNYIPKNNKLFTYPYNFFNITNNSGITESFKYEDFAYDPVIGKKSIALRVESSLTPGMSIKAIPLFYKNENINYNFGIVGGKLPVCSYNSDVYQNWLRQNGLNTVFNLIGGGISVAGGIGSGSVSGALSGITNIYNTLHQVTLVDMTPNQAKGNTNAGDINFSNNSSGLFSVYKMSIKEEYAKIIDDYFTMFGYKVNKLKIPNITGRTNWNYVKTIECNFDGDIPQSHLSIIRNMFNNGVTLWHNPNTIYNYNLSNNII